MMGVMLNYSQLRFSQEAQCTTVNFASNFNTVFPIASELVWTKRANLITGWSILRNYYYLARVLEYRNIVLYPSNSSTKNKWKFHLQWFLKSMAHKQTINFQCLNTLKGIFMYYSHHMKSAQIRFENARCKVLKNYVFASC